MKTEKDAASEDWLSAPVAAKSTTETASSGPSDADSADWTSDPVSTSRYKSSFTNSLSNGNTLYPPGEQAITGVSPAVDAELSPGPATSVGLGSTATTTVRTAKSRRANSGPRRAKLQLRHIDPWSTLKLSLILAVVFFFVWMIAVAILYGVLSAMDVFDYIDSMFAELGGTGGTIVTPKLVFGGAALIGAVNIVLFTALATIGSYIYNLCADLAGGLEITLAERR